MIAQDASGGLSQPIAANRAGKVMDVILHLGAHRTGTTGFQDYMRRHKAALTEQQVGFWGPGRTRRGLFSGIIPGPGVARGRDLRTRGEGRVQLRLKGARHRGVKTLVVSDENMLGTVRENLCEGSLYPSAGERTARFARAFDGEISGLLLSVRSLELWWCSALAFGVSRGHPLPMKNKLAMIAGSQRGWRDVVTDVACAVPGVPIRVMPFESFAGRSDVFLARGTGIDAPPDNDRQWLNRAPRLPDLRRVLTERGTEAAELPFGMGRWNPFSNEQHAALREVYADDIMWLTAGADGLATLTEDRIRTRAGTTPPAGSDKKGQPDEHEERQVARPG